MGHQLSPQHRLRGLTVPLRGDGRLDPKGGGMGCRRARGSSHRSGADE